MFNHSLQSYEVDLYEKVHLVDPSVSNFAEVSSLKMSVYKTIEGIPRDIIEISLRIRV